MKFRLAYHVLLTGALTLSACSATGYYSVGPFRGRVVDAGTKKPLAGAAVLAIWYKQALIGGFGGPPSLFYDAQEALTDANGEFSLPGLHGFFLFSKVRGPEVIIFKPGYGSYPNFAPGDEWRDRLTAGQYTTIELPLARTREMRLRSSDINPVSVPDDKKREVLRLLHIDHEELFPRR